MSDVWQWSEWFLRKLMGIINAVPVIFWVCMLADLLGFVVGAIVWYGPQLQQAPWWAWLFIPDCPLAALLGMLAFIRLRQGVAPDWLTAIASLSCIKYGIWTVLFWGTKWAATGEVLPIEVGLVVVHLAMAGQGLLLWPALLEVALPIRMAAVAWLALSVVVDYVFGHHPALVPSVTAMQAGTWAAVLTVLLGVAMWLLHYRPMLASATARAT
jgi:uncharacterized membrane protein YpjA